MRPSRFELGVRTGTVVTSATVGVLAAIGHAAGNILFPFVAEGHLILGTSARLAWVLALAGLTRHFVLHVAVATLFVSVAGRFRGWPLVLTAGATGLGLWAAVPHLPDALHPVALVLTPGEGVIYYLTLAAALVAGVLLGAFPARADAGRGISMSSPDGPRTT